MTQPASFATLVSMDEEAERSLRLVIDLEGGAERLAGSLSLPDGRVRRFGSWLELASAIQTCRDAIAAADDD